MSNRSPDCRAIAAQCLACVYKGLSLKQQLILFEQQVDKRDRALLKQLCYGVLRFYPTLLGSSQQLLQKPLKNKDSDILMLILLGGYQLTSTRIPAHAAVSATVAATISLKKPWAKALVNAVLRQWQRKKEQLHKQLTPAQLLAHPEWLQQAIEKAWPQQAESIQQENNQHPPMCLRINRLAVSRTNYLQKLQEASIHAELCKYSPCGVRLNQAVAVSELPEFYNGWVSIQDEAAQLAPPLLSLKPGLRVLDACCAPGGKTCHIMESEPGLDEVIALDIDEKRLAKVSENLSRLALTAVTTVGDALQPDTWWDGRPFDRILLDAPCSATGVIRRNPDIKLHRQPKDIQQLSRLQVQLLCALWETLSPQGLLLYATCSIIPDENEKLIAQFCEQQIQAEPQTIDVSWGIQRPFGRQLFPQRNGHDGFYYALLKKRPS